VNPASSAKPRANSSVRLAEADAGLAAKLDKGLGKSLAMEPAALLFAY
jgi:hypothetical protein